ncbi:MAG: hypothetical protein AAB964_01285 [Patescibacteria group bacterium]
MPQLEGSNDDYRQIHIQARPATLSEEPRRGMYDPSVLPVVHATIDFVSGETSVYVWRFRSLSVMVKNWKYPLDFYTMSYASDLPELNNLAERLLKHRNGNEIKRQSPSEGGSRGPRFLGAPTSF